MKAKTATTLFCVFLVLIIGFSAYFGFESYKAQQQFSELKLNYTQTLNFEDRLLNFNNWAFQETDLIPRQLVSNQMIEEFNGCQKEANTNGLYVLCTGFFGVLLLLLISKYTHIKQRLMGVAILSVASVALAYGVVCPMLEIEFFKDDMTIDLDLKNVREPLKKKIMSSSENLGIISSLIGEETTASLVDQLLGHADSFLKDRSQVFEGRMYFYYQSKSIYDIVSLLWRQHNYFVAVAIAMFSVLIPLLKIIVSLILISTKSLRNKKRWKLIVGIIGKWSMADVFVGAIYLAYMSFGNLNIGIDTKSNTLIGLYFFAAYVILSIVSYFIVDAYMKETPIKK